MSLKVVAPCSTKNIQGLDDEGLLTVYLDEERTLTPTLENDDDGNSWELSCGTVSQIILHNAPNFVTYDLKEEKIKV